MPLDSINQVDDVEMPPTTPTAPAGPITAFLEMVVTGPYVNVSQATCILEAGAVQWVLCGVTLRGLADGREVDPAQYPVNLAVVQQDPQSSDWQAGQWIVRSAAPDGDYALIAIGPGEAIAPVSGRWRVYVQVAAGGQILEMLAPGYLIVE